MNSTYKRWLYPLIVTISSAAFALVLVEGTGRLAIRYLEHKRPSGIFGEFILNHKEPLIGFGLKKNVHQDAKGWSIDTNSLGYRENSEIGLLKPSDELRLFVIGGSTVFGWGVNANESIPAYLQREIDERAPNLNGKHIRVINAGIPWYASWHEAALVYFRLLDLQPDWIISLDGLNDTAQSIGPEWEPIHLGYLDTPTRVAFERKFAPKQSGVLVSELLNYSETFRYFSARATARKETAEGAYHPAVWDQYLNLKDRVFRLTQSLGIRFTTFFQPVMVLDKPLSKEEIETNDTAMKSPQVANVFRETYLEGERRLKSAPFPYFNVRNIFKNTNETIYVDGQHYNALGNAILAKKIFELEVSPQLNRIVKN